jgi:dTDP-4-amino-4,6-dideoxygalactose transaminase
MKVPALDLKAQYKRIEREIEEAVQRTLSSGSYILGETVHKFEAEAAEYLGAPHAVAVASGTDALSLSLRCAGVGPGDGVVTSPFTYFATTEAVLHLGAVPIYVDTEEETFNLSLAALGDYFRKHTEKRKSSRFPVDRKLGVPVKAVMPVHLYGLPADMAGICALAKELGVSVVEDAAQAFGAGIQAGRGRFRMAGTFGDAGCFSFYPTKNLGAYGDGGLVTVGTSKADQALRLLRCHGETGRHRHQVLGFNSRLDAVQAAILSVKLRHLKTWSEERIEKAGNYIRLFEESWLAGASGAKGPQAATDDAPLRLPLAPETYRHIYHQFTLRARKRDELRAHLESRGVAAIVHYPVPAYRQPALRTYRWGGIPCRTAEKHCREVLCIPIFAELTDQQQRFVVESIQEFYRLMA